MSFIYRNILIYRIIMQVLYFGKYTRRFRDIIALFDGNDRVVVELCFGDIVIASYCRRTGRTWTGYDINSSFINLASDNGYCAKAVDISAMESIPNADVCIVAGSLYHFHDSMDKLLALMLDSAPKILISEPIRNLTSQSGWVGKIAAALSNAGKGREHFRYNRESLIQILDYYKKKYKFSYDIVSEGKDILIKVSHERNQHRHTDL